VRTELHSWLYSSHTYILPGNKPGSFFSIKNVMRHIWLHHIIHI
jgi:hypothetical protein